MTSSAADATGTAPADPAKDPPEGARASARRSVAARLGLVQFSGVYGLVIIIVLFGFLEPDLFLSKSNVNLILVNSAITGILALGVLVPLAAGLLDLSFASVAGFSLIFTAWMSNHVGINSFLIAGLSVLVSGVFGLVSGLLVAYLSLDSLIVTLGMSSVALGLTQLITNGNTIDGVFDSSFQALGLHSVGVVPYLAIVLFVGAVLLYLWLEHTPGGRFVLTTGSNLTAARLAGLKVRKIQILTLTFSALVAGLAGALLMSRTATGTDTTGQGYLLPVVAGLFLGTTQIRTRPNVWGTILGVYLLGTGIQGIQLEGNAPWVNSLFNGIVLLIAVAIGVLRFRAIRRTADKAG
jgi:ribose transport system permease protein